MDVYDSGVWVWGLTGKASEAVDLIEEVVDGDRYVAVNSYIHGEVIEAFDRATRAGTEDIHQAKKNFNVIVSKRHNIEFVDHEAIEQMDIHAVRELQTIRLLGLSWEIQTKDVPIIMLAEQFSNPATIYTTDRDLSEFEPSTVGIEDVTTEYVPTP